VPLVVTAVDVAVAVGVAVDHDAVIEAVVAVGGHGVAGLVFHPHESAPGVIGVSVVLAVIGEIAYRVVGQNVVVRAVVVGVASGELVGGAKGAVIVEFVGAAPGPIAVEGSRSGSSLAGVLPKSP
jgi:hypothetical protein